MGNVASIVHLFYGLEEKTSVLREDVRGPSIRIEPLVSCLCVLMPSKLVLWTSRDACADSTLQLRPEDPSSSRRAARRVVHAPVRDVARAAPCSLLNRLAGMALPALFPKQRYVSFCPSIAVSPSKPNFGDVCVGIRRAAELHQT
jgi:hypothetical protein